MGEADRYIDFKRPKKNLLFGADNNALVALFTLNIIFYLTLLTIQVVYFFFQADRSLFESQVVQYFILPAKLTTLSERPWTVLSFMFTHVEVLHILSNMLWLWAFGYILQEMAGNRKIIPVYIYGGLLGSVFYIAANYSFPFLRPFIETSFLGGGNASTMAVAVATTTLAPGYRFFRNLNGGIPIWILTAIYILIDVAGVATFSAAESLAHLGGGLAGFLFIYLYKKGVDTGEWMNRMYEWFIDLFNPNKKAASKNIKEKIFYKSQGRKPYQKHTIVTQQRIDDILDKINQHGYHFLSDEEKIFLKKASEEDL